MERLAPLSARDLTIGHGTRVLAQQINFALQAHEIMALLGPNGVGKTTLMRTLLGLTPALAGAVYVQGEDLSTLPRRSVARHLAHVPQQLSTAFAYSALDIVLMGASSRLGPFDRPGKADIAAAETALDRLGIMDLAAQPVTRLSGGQRQLVLIARALTQGARCILMDEPTASLDIANRRAVDAAIRSLAAQGTAVLLSSHDPDQAVALADHVLLLGRDGVIAQGATDETLTAAALSDLYGTQLQTGTRPDGNRYFY
ncbi:iron complex transport system ATP-binding protein (plasmid) [Ketogulonicigenium robustum]|uniref:Iron complex transport system ATP-binding protein n=1 Tax=Ketogulonicigenium robustum TaxID=92947 RepID=A0A1W6P3L0_9RHOB|nr:ABC transporter ATP-binding protein [Ketogulonicigenium robustum]ARO15927.1 iron complex transport system ATP-binding protein [Ketogulonicigenium robustum]